MSLLTIRQLAARAGISRATLLYYESAGLMHPACRNSSGYRLYGPDELNRLLSIRAFRDAGIPVSAIKTILENRSNTSTQLLEARLLEIDGEIRLLREQQIVLARLLAQETLAFPDAVNSKDSWIALLRKAGLSDADMHRWHAEFEATSPEAHGKFLLSLGLSADEAAAIRNKAKTGLQPKRKSRS